MNEEYDAAVVGGCVVGCAIARELSRYQLNVLVLEKESDVARGTSDKNSGVLHTGFNVPKGSLKARLNVLGASMFEELCTTLNVPFKRVGKLVVALSAAEAPDLEKLKAPQVHDLVDYVSLEAEKAGQSAATHAQIGKLPQAGIRVQPGQGIR